MPLLGMDRRSCKQSDLETRVFFFVVVLFFSKAIPAPASAVKRFIDGVTLLMRSICTKKEKLQILLVNTTTIKRWG